MDAKEYFEKYCELKGKQKRVIEEIKQEYNELEAIHSLADKTGSRCTPTKDLAKHIKLLQQQVKETECEASNIQALIESISGDEGKVLQLRYIDGCTWEQVCERIFYSWPKVRQLHIRALEIAQGKIDNTMASE